MSNNIYFSAYRPLKSIFMMAICLFWSLGAFANTDPKVHHFKATAEAARHPLTTQSNQDVLEICDLEIGTTYSVYVNVPKGQKYNASLALAGATAMNNGQGITFTATKTCTEISLNGTADKAYVVTIGDNKPANANKMAVITTNSGVTPAQMVDALTDGTCFTVSNITYVGAATAKGTFASGNSIGINNGIVLSTGNIATVAGPNTLTGAGTNNLLGGDADLAALTTTTVYDASVLEFDLTVGPTTTFLSFNYAFGSEEYCFYTNSTYNDVFGFFVSGAAPGGGTYSNYNIAQIPGANVPVTINNVNHTLNSLYYISNIPASLSETGGGCDGHPIASGPATTDCQLDGFTQVLNASFNCVPGQTYHIKLAIGDAGDGILDSDVFLQTNSLNCEVSCGNLVVNCPAPIVVDDSGDCGAYVGNAYPFISSNCPVNTSYQLSGPNGAWSGVGDASGWFVNGTTNIVYTVTDITGNTANCSFSVTVTAPAPPPCPESITLYADLQSGCGAYYGVEFYNNYCSEVCGVRYELTGATKAKVWGYSLNAYFELGVTNVTRVIQLKNGTFQTCTFSVTVLDNLPPVLNCPEGTIYLYPEEGACQAKVCGYDLFTADNCGVESLSHNVTGGTSASGPGLINGVLFTGSSLVVYTATDYSGNTSICSFNVDVYGGTFVYYQDLDGDGFGNSEVVFQGCPAPQGYVATGGDCNDLNPTIFPYAPEVCDGKDNDCDGYIDEGFAALTYYTDNDGDGFGGQAVTSCDPFPPAGLVTNSLDCNDANAAVNPSATEVCNNLDDDCDGLVNEGNVCCSNPSVSSAVTLSATSVLVTWPAIPGATNYQIRYRIVGGTTWTVTTAAGNTTSRIITGLTANTNYQYQIRTFCSGAWLTYGPTVPFTFNTTLTAACTAPTPLFSVSTGATKQMLYWGAVTGATGYTVQYKTVAAATWTTAPIVTVTNLELTGLVPGTTYQYRVRVRCTQNPITFSPYSVISTFTVPLLPQLIDNAPESNVDFGIALSSSVAVFPNPATKVLNVEIENFDVVEMKVMNINGQEMLKLSDGQLTDTIDISQLVPGVYLFSVKDADGNIKSEQFIKK